LNISEAGIALIKESEKLRLDSYPDPATGGDPWTIGWGHTGSDIVPGMRVTQEQAELYFALDIEKIEKCINNCVSIQLTQGQFDALCSFVFNLGCMALRNSTLLRKLNASDNLGAAEEFKKWDHAGGRVLAGLTIRRAKEAQLFLA
jgi:lysozyme